MEPVQSGSSALRPEEQAYDALNKFFSAHESEVAEIEILPSAIQPTGGLLLQEGLNIGVPKKVLVLAYVRARKLFFDSLEAGGKSWLSMEASRTMLLFDPENITVTNFRKRWILRLTGEDQDGFNRACILELVFLNSILTSPLHRQSKSPTLWHHRLWLLDSLVPIQLADQSGKQFLTFARAELDAVLKAGERHPKNYYAWQYARRLFARIETLYKDDTDHVWKASSQKFLVKCALLIKVWCCKHPADISGWTFLLFLLPSLHSVPHRRDIVKQVLEYAINLRIEQESLWVFLRTALADSFLEEERASVIQSLYNYQKERADAVRIDHPEDCVTNAMIWITSYGKNKSEIRPTGS